MNVFRKLTAYSLFLSALSAISPAANALQINGFESLTRKQIEQSYFFDWNRNSIFRASLIKAFKTSKLEIPTWIRKGGGPSAPAKVIDSGNTHYVLLNTCKSHDCDENNIYMLFDPVSKVTGIVGKLNNKTTWIGSTTPAIKQILSNASGLH